MYLKQSQQHLGLRQLQSADSEVQPKKTHPGKERRYAYVILVGCVNVYDLALTREEALIDENEMRECIGEESTERTGQTTVHDSREASFSGTQNKQMTFVT